MSTLISGRAPTIEVLNITLSSAHTDEVSVKHLLNITSSTNYFDYVNVTVKAGGSYDNITSVSSNLMFSTASNKSLFVFEHTNITTNYTINTTTINAANQQVNVTATVDTANTDVLDNETISLNVTLNTGGRTISTSQANIYLEEVNSTNQDQMTAQDHIRILNAGSSTANIDFEMDQLNDALGVENKIYNFNVPTSGPTYWDIGTSTLASQNLTLVIASSQNVTSFGMYQISYENADLTIANDFSHIYNSSGNLVGSETNLEAFEIVIPDDTKSFVINVAAENTTTYPISLISGDDKFFSIDGTGMNNTSSLVTNLPDTLTATISARQLAREDNLGNNYTGYITIDMINEAPIITGPAVITFQSTNRAVSNSVNVTAQIVYAGENVTAQIVYAGENATLSSLSTTVMALENANYKIERVYPSTINFTDGRTITKNGLNTYYDRNADFLNIGSFSNTSNKSFIARVTPLQELALSEEFNSNTLYNITDDTKNITDISLNITNSLVQNSTTIIDWRVRFTSNAANFLAGVTTEASVGSNVVLTKTNATKDLYNYDDENGPIYSQLQYRALYNEYNLTAFVFNQRYDVELPNLEYVRASDLLRSLRPASIAVTAFKNNETEKIRNSRPIYISPFDVSAPTLNENITLTGPVALENDVSKYTYSIRFTMDSHMSLVKNDAIKVAFNVSYDIYSKVGTNSDGFETTLFSYENTPAFDVKTKNIYAARINVSNLGLLYKSHEAVFEQTENNASWRNIGTSKLVDLRTNDNTIELGTDLNKIHFTLTSSTKESIDHEFILHLKSTSKTIYDAKYLELSGSNIISVVSDPANFNMNVATTSVNGAVSDNIVDGVTQRTVSIVFGTDKPSIVYTYLKNPLDDTVTFVYNHTAWVRYSLNNGVNFTPAQVADGARWSIDSGVHVTLNNVNTSPTASNGIRELAIITLNKDSSKHKKSDTDPETAFALIPSDKQLFAKNPTFGVDSLYYRGFPNGLVITIKRDGPVKVSLTGFPDQTITVPGTVSFGNGYGFTVKQIPTSGNETAVYKLNKSTIKIKFDNVEKYNAVIGSSLGLDSIVTDNTTLYQKILRLFHLNNYFVGANLLTFTYTQKPINIKYINNSEAKTIVGTGSTSTNLANARTKFAPVSNFKSFADSTISINSTLLFNGHTIGVGKTYRPLAKNFYLTVAPIVATLRVRTATAVGISPSITTIFYEMLAQDGYNLKHIEISINERTAKYTLFAFVDHVLKSNNSVKYFTFNPHRFQILGSNEYASQHFGTETTEHTYDQKIVTNVADTMIAVPESQIKVSWSNNYPRKYGGAHAIGTIAPEDNIKVTSYQLGFEILSGSDNQYSVSPVITKLVSKMYSNKLVSHSYIREFAVESGQKIKITTDSNIDFPYKCAMTSYPIPSSQASPVIAGAPIAIASDKLPAKLDLVLRIKSKELYYKLIAPTSDNKINIVKIDAKDQLVVKDYFNNLSMRVGPNGRLYVGDISSYTFAIYSNTFGSGLAYNSPYLPIHNSTVALGNGELFLNNAN